MMRKSCCIYATGIIATHLLIVGIALMIADVFPGIIIKRLKAEITLTEGSKVFDSWKNPPPPVFMEFFFFNVTNPNEYNSGLAKPRVVEVGPYTYREYRPKENVTFVENGTKVAAYTPKTFVFLREKSVGDPTVDRITTVNVPALAVMNQMQGSFFRAPVAKAWLKMLNITGVLTKLTVDELLWGYEDPLLKKAASLKKVQTSFGFMLDKNGTHDGELVYFTGEKDYLDYGRVDTWKGQRELTYWGSNYSNLIRGSDGSAFHPYLTREETLHIFTPDLCRSIYMNFDKDVEVKGIPAYRFTPPRSVLASAKENPDNEGFCPSPKKGCLGSGVLKVDVCKKDVPIVASFPHFYLGDEEYPNAIDGISPVKEHHQTYVDLNPTTGIMVRASKRAQFNILVEYLSSFPITKGLNTTVFPLFFLNETVVVDDASAARLHKLLLIAKIGSNFPVFIIALGALLVIILLIIIIRLHMKKSEVKRFDFSEAYPYLSTTSKEDTIYSPVNDKTEDYDNSKNGNYVGMTPVKAERA